MVWWLVLVSCVRAVPPVPPVLPLPPLCAADLSGWKPERPPSGFIQLSAEQVGSMVAPSMVEAQRRACDCLARGVGEAGAYRLVVLATPGRGQASATLFGEGALPACVGALSTVYEGWDIGCGDVIDPSTPASRDCAASVRLPVILDLSW